MTSEISGRDSSSLPDFLRDDPDGSDLPGWMSPPSLELIWNQLKSQIRGNTDCFSRHQVHPVYATPGEFHYRVHIYMKDFIGNGTVVSHQLWKTFYVIASLDLKIKTTSPKL